MVMKKNMMRRNLQQSILKSLGRYVAIMAIIALGSSLFVGLLMTKSDMVATGQVYTDEQNMFDLRLVNSYGWAEEQLDQVKQLDGIVDAEGVFYTDLIAQWGKDAEDQVYRFYTIPETVNRLVLLEGRLPEAPDECLADGYHADSGILGTKVYLSDTNEEDALETALYDVYTVVGYVSTPLYMDMNRGTTSVGSGSISNYFFVPGEAFDVDYYTEIHVTMPGEWKIYSKEYNDAMDTLADTLEPLVEPMAQERLEQVRSDAEEEYADGYQEYLDGEKEYRDGKLEGENALYDAFLELKNGEKEMEDARQLLVDGEQQIADGKQAIVDGRKTLSASRKTLADAKATTYAQLADANAELMKNYQTVSNNLMQVNNGLLQLDAGMLELETGITQLESGLEQLDSGIEMIEMLVGVLDISMEAAQKALEYAQNSEIVDEEHLKELEAKVAELEQKQAEYAAQLADLQNQRVEYGAQLEELYVTRMELQAQIQELEANKQILEQAQATIDTGFLELQAGQTQADNQFAAAEAQIQAGEAQMDAAEAELLLREEEIADGWIELEEGEAELQDGWEEYYDGLRELRTELKNARTELDDAKEKLEEARKTIDDMTETQLYILDRNTNIGYASLDSASDIVAGVSKVFPAFFLLVAALVCITTMTRMVEDERTQIGTLKALGYSNNAIIGKYLAYAGSGAVLGCGLGVTLGSMVFPSILWEAYKIMLFITDRIVLTFNWWLCLAVVGAYTIVILSVTWYCCRRSLREVPAELIRPKTPDAGKKLLFEKLPFWNRMGFLNKVMIRNIFRYKQRLAMMLVGIGGCTALLLTGFGLRDSIVNIVDFQYEEVTVYDMEVYFSEGLTEDQQASFRRKTAEQCENVMFYHQSSIEVDFEDRVREIYLMAASDEIQEFIDFHNDDGNLDMPGMNEVLLSVGTAEAMGIQVGDTILLRDSDMRTMHLTVSGIYNNHVYNYAIVLPETMEAQHGELPEQQMALVKVKEGLDIHSVGAEITGLDHVMNVSVSEDMADMVRNMMDALDLVVVVVVVSAGALGAIVLYNLTNINITERIREIATIKVLGFRAGETAAYVFKENMALTAVGTILGLGLGKLLLEFVMSQIKIDMVWFDSRILWPSIVWAVVLTILTSCIVDFVFYFRLDKINMAEALKSVE